MFEHIVSAPVAVSAPRQLGLFDQAVTKGGIR